MSLRLRLTLWYLATLFVLLALFIGYFLDQAYWTLIEQTDTTLTLVSDQAQGYINLQEEPSFLDVAGLIQVVNQIDSNLTIQIVSPDGQVYDRVSNDEHHFLKEDSDAEHEDETPPFVVPLPNTKEPPFFTSSGPSQTFEYDGLNWRVHNLPLRLNEEDVVWLQALQSLENVDLFYQNQRNQMLWAMPLALLLAGLGGYWLAVRTLQPIDQMTHTAQAISTQELQQRIDYRGADDEVGRLAKTFDAMLDRLQKGFDRERRFISDAAHELRTPLTALKGNIEVALSRPRQPEAYIDLLDDLGGQVDRLVRLSNGLLFMARLDHAQSKKLDVNSINIGHLLSSVLDQVRGPAEQKQIRLEATLPADLEIQGDLDLLIRLFLNLLDNAIKYTPPDGLINISTEIQPGQLLIQIKDSGLGIAAEHLPYLFDRFYRVEQHRSQGPEQGGAGLGLTIAQEIAKAHGGQIWVDSRPPHGTTFTINLRF